MSDNEKSQVTEENTAPAQEEAGTLSVSDLSALKSIIDVASQRGAFKPNEMIAVGTIYGKLSSFLDTVAKQAAAAQQGE